MIEHIHSRLLQRPQLANAHVRLCLAKHIRSMNTRLKLA